ncbi:kinase-like protein [Rhizophagus irregularis]|uniref:Kinase-like protein n=1 Tax=Rhizophagus irregularis TaxID=588596 RepID=A0A2N1MK03_9GLOM|nr:kinase-like protein [Rhizophagus irregularis]
MGSAGGHRKHGIFFENIDSTRFAFSVLSLEEALSCVPPPVTYSPSCVTSKTTTKVNGEPPSKVLLWRNLFDQVNKYCFDQQPKFERPRFVVKEIVNEEDVQVAMDVNMCMVLSSLMTPGYNFSRLPTHTTGVPDFTCFYLASLLVLTIEVKRKHVLQEIGENTLPEFYRKNEKARMVVQQIFNYMEENNLRYSILSTYDSHWFLKREHTKLWISRTLPLQSVSPPVLKTYAYLAQHAQSDPYSLHPLQVPVQADGDNNSRTLRSHSKLLSNQAPDQQSSSDYSQTYYTSVGQHNNYSFADFKFQSILGEGRSGKTLLCEFRGNTIALKSADLSKTPLDIVEEMKKEVEIYKILADIQGKYIPKLICYGYYGGGMSFVIGMTIVGTPLCDDHKLTKQQKAQALKALKKIHDHGILHNDIREENILVDSKGNVFLIDFGMASRDDFHKNRTVFNEELRQFSRLLDKYIT